MISETYIIDYIFWVRMFKNEKFLGFSVEIIRFVINEDKESIFLDFN